MTSKKEKPYLALLGQSFEVWEIVEVISDTRSHICVREVAPGTVAKLGHASSSENMAIEKKFVLAHTKGFEELPHTDALELVTILQDNLNAYKDEMNENIENTKPDYAGDAKGLREFVREARKEFGEYWTEEIDKFKNELLPQAAVDYWEAQRDEAKGRAELAERARLRALEKVRKPS